MNLGEFWRPTLTVIGIEGIPTDLNTAGNVVYKELKYRLSVRTAPNHDCDALAEQIREAIMGAPEEVTFGANIEFEVIDKSNGFAARDLPQDIKDVLF